MIWQGKSKEVRTVRVLKIAFGILFLSVVALFIWGEIFMPREHSTGSTECILLEARWERVFADGTRETVELPGNCDAKPGEAVRLQTTLPQSQENTWFCMRASQQDMQVYVGEELRAKYSTKETRLFGRNSASSFVFFEIFREDAGKVLTIELVSDSEYAGFLNEVYVGDKYDIVQTFIHQCALVLLVSVYMFILSSIVLLIGLILRIGYRRRVDIIYLALGTMQLSMTMIAESRIRQFFLPNASIAEHVGFWLTMLLPYPFMVYVNRIQKGRYVKAYKIVSLCVAVNFILSTLLQLRNILDLGDTVYVSYALIFIMVLVIMVTICLDIRKRKIREYGELIYAFVVMVLVSVWELYVNVVPQSPVHGGIVLSFGLIILLFAAGIKSVRDMLSVEQEKQMAIAASEAKAQFLANMSHEIRTPINTILGMNEMILRENQNEEVAEYARNVQNASKLLLGLINDILDFSKIEAGKLDIVEADYHLAGMLTDVVNGIQIKVDSKKLALEVQVEDTLPSVLRGDELRIRQIMNNLLSNAVKYTKQGTIILTVKGTRSRDSFALDISVEDTGIGIKPEDLDKLFSSFQRLEEQKNRYIEGTGLGLNITKQLVELMGGNIAVQSEYGKGSCFTVQIPQQIMDETPIGILVEADRGETMTKNIMLASSAGMNAMISDNVRDDSMGHKLYAPTATILVVDDNEMNLAVVKALLKRTGIVLTLAPGGLECLELCRSNKYDLILMDHMMPEPDGIETLHMLRGDEHSLNRNTDVIVITANAIAGMAEKYLEEGFKDYLSKPIVAEELEAMIYRHLPEDKLENCDIDDCMGGKSFGADVVDSEVIDAVEKAAPMAADADSVAVSDIYDIDAKLGLEYCANDEGMYQEMKKTYVLQGQKYLQQLPEYYKARDWKNYKVTVHAIKSSSLLIGAANLSQKAKRLELAAGNQEEEVLLTESEDFFAAYKTLLEKLEMYL